MTMRIAVVALAGWLGVVGAGIAGLWKYAETPGTAAAAPGTWPSGSRLTHDPARPTLVMFAHPKCPCTRASIGELAILMTRAKGRVAAHVVFLTPETADASWEESDLRSSAAAIPGVLVASDRNGVEAEAFGVVTSGDTLLYDARGDLLFSGGITAARGHAGDNAGRDALVALLTTDRTVNARTPVFGCALRDSR